VGQEDPNKKVSQQPLLHIESHQGKKISLIQRTLQRQTQGLVSKNLRRLPRKVRKELETFKEQSRAEGKRLYSEAHETLKQQVKAS
jgi:hypothetical protein